MGNRNQRKQCPEVQIQSYNIEKSIGVGFSIFREIAGCDFST